MYKQLRITVVIPCLNEEQGIEQVLRSMPAFVDEVIVVDNNSTDGSMAIAREHPIARVMAETRQGAYAARNSGVCAARGRWIAFTDPDCVPRPDWLRQLVAHMADPQRVWLVLAMATTLAGNLTVLGSVANVIVVQRAKPEVRINFWEYLRVGAPLTVVTIAFGVFWLG